MRLVNCTDKKTPTLEQYGHVDQSIEVGGELVKPGASVDVDSADRDHLSNVHAHLLEIGALKWEEAKTDVAAAKPEAVPALASNELPNALVDIAKKDKGRS